MTRRSYVQIDGVLYERGTEPRRETRVAGPTIIPDSPDFVSPIDHTIVRGKAGIREHCARHGVVQTAELKGLPYGIQPVAPNRQEIRETILRRIAEKGYSEYDA
jgi:hypothetical protein